MLRIVARSCGVCHGPGEARRGWRLRRRSRCGVRWLPAACWKGPTNLVTTAFNTRAPPCKAQKLFSTDVHPRLRRRSGSLLTFKGHKEETAKTMHVAMSPMQQTKACQSTFKNMMVHGPRMTSSGTEKRSLTPRSKCAWRSNTQRHRAARGARPRSQARPRRMRRTKPMRTKARMLGFAESYCVVFAKDRVRPDAGSASAATFWPRRWVSWAMAGP